MNKARNISIALGSMIGAYTGIEFPAASRKGAGEKGTNADVIDHLRDGGRDLGPSKEDAQKTAAEYTKRVKIFLRQQKDTKKPPSTAKTNQAGAKALRAAAAIVQKVLVNRIEKSEDMDGQVNHVDPTYAKQRERKHGVPKGEVFKASGQLIADLARGTGKLTKK